MNRSSDDVTSDPASASSSPPPTPAAAMSVGDMTSTIPTEYGTLFTTRSGSLGKILMPDGSPDQLSSDAMLSQSLTAADPLRHLLAVPTLHRALSTSPRLEHTSPNGRQNLDNKTEMDDDSLFFPFCESNQDIDLSTSMPSSVQDTGQPSHHLHHHHHNPEFNSYHNTPLGNSVPTGGGGGQGNNKERSSSVISGSSRAGLLGSGKFKFFSRNGSMTSINRGPRRLTSRQDSQMSNASSIGRSNSIFGSALFGSPSRRSSLSQRVNYVTDSPSVYPSLTSICSFDQMSMTMTDVPQSSPPLKDVIVYDVESFPPINSTNGHVSASYEDKIDQTEKLERSESVLSAGMTEDIDLNHLQRSISLPSKYAHQKGKAYFPSAVKINTPKNTSAEKLDDEQIDELSELKSNLTGVVPTGKKKWQQTMPDLVEGPESETLTLQSTARNQLAMAALAIIRGEYKEEMVGKKEDEDEEMIDEKKERRKYMKNLLVIGFVFFFIFTPYLSLRNLQSSLNDTGGLGMYSLSCVYAFLCIGCIFTTTIVQRLRPKIAMLVGLQGFLLYNLANFYPSFYTLIPASCLVGFCLAIMWTSHATYMANISSSFADLTGNTMQNVMSKFNGIFFTFFQSSQIVGGLISSLILTSQMPSNVTIFDDNQQQQQQQQIFFNLSSMNEMTTFTMMNNITNADVDEEGVVGGGYRACGMRYCPGKTVKKSTNTIEPYMLYLLMAIFLVCTIVGIVILFFFLDPLEGIMKKSTANIKDQMSAVFKFFAKPNILLLIGLMLYSLLQVSFMFGEFSKAYVTCTLGIHMVGYLMLCLSVSSGVFAYAMGILQKRVGRIVLLLSALSLHLVLLIVMLLWTPTNQTVAVFFLVAAGWGAGDGIFGPQLISLIGTLFANSKEPAFAAYKMTQSMSAFFLFITGPYICTRYKIVILIVVIVIAAVGYVILEVKLRVEGRRTKDVIVETVIKVESEEKEDREFTTKA